MFTINFDGSVLIIPLGSIIVEPTILRNILQELLVTFQSPDILVFVTDEPMPVF